MKGYLPLILIMGAVLSGIIWIFILTNDSPEINNPKYTIGEIVRFTQGTKSSGLGAVIQYVVDEIEYETTIGSFADKANVIGEKYKVKYDSQNPEKRVVLTESPVFLDDELTRTTKGKITKFSLTSHKGRTGFIFKYKISNKDFIKAQTIQSNYKEQYPDLKEGNSYEVEYWEQNPERAIIYLDKPIK